MEQSRVKEIVKKMTLAEKAALTSGYDNWFTKTVERLEVPAIRTSDGPHGLRTQEGDGNSIAEGTSKPAVCFPSACTTAASFDKKLLRRMGEALGHECQALGVNILLGPGVNMKRSPLCGRNFEYFSEDPYLAGELGAAYVDGVQSQGIGTSLKHFFANSQEHRRMDSSSEMDERTMREIYLQAFETVVKKAQPWTVMAAYNRIGGIYATANETYLTGVLREEWGFDGLVISDWGATHDRAAAIAAGCDLTMPTESTDEEIVRAVNEDRLDEADLDACCERIVSLALKSAELHLEEAVFNYESDHRLARKIAEQSIILLKNEAELLPLDPVTETAFIGPFASTPRFQGGGSSHVTSFKVVNALAAAETAGYTIHYAQGCQPNGELDEAMIAEAVETARKAQAAVLFIGLPDEMESEGVDRSHLRLPKAHDQLVERVCAVQPNTVVVLHNGSPVEMPWIDRPKAILEAYLGGQAVGEAVVNILYGKVNPSGHLAETFPLKLEDNPSYLYYQGESGEVQYNEGIFVGYRYYESKKQQVLFPFGYGLSYTTFAYSNLCLDRKQIKEGEELTVSVQVKNTGTRTGKTVVQLYVAPEKVEAIRPVRELKEFAKIELKPAETKTVTLTLSPRAFMHWNRVVHAFRAENGVYRIEIGRNAHEIMITDEVQVEAAPILPSGGYNISMPMCDFIKNPMGYQFVDQNIAFMIKGMAVLGYIPQELITMTEQVSGELTLKAITKMAGAAEAAPVNGGNDGFGLLLSQSLSILYSFLTEEKKEELMKLIEIMN